MLFESKDYRTFLKLTLADKSRQRTGYSLRNFAERLSVSSSFLSEVLNSKKSLSVELAFKIALRLGLTDLETQYFCLLVQYELEKDASIREEILARLNLLNPKRKSFDLSVDLFKAISEWYHAAILELTYLTSFKMNPISISKKLGISKNEAKIAIERLLRLEMIEKCGDGKYRKTHEYFFSTSDVPTMAFRDYHKDILRKAATSLESRPPNQRVSASDVFAIDSKFIKEIDRMSLEFSSAVMKLAEKSKVYDSVYALSVHCYELTERKEVNHD